MYKFKMLSGEELVTQGAKKVNSSLPELGLKDIVPNGSWLEQKQIQCSLEARRHIVEVERIEKYGSLSQADWNEELQLAVVTKHTGGHWQYVGHHIGRQLYLYPEEALYLMEVSCLQLKYNDVAVSIQQAYSLLLKDNVSLIQYKAYASLSRLGYKVLRHTYVKAGDTENEENKDKLEDSTSTNPTCEITDISMEKESEENDAKEDSKVNIPNAEYSETTETVSKLSSDKTCKVTEVKHITKENTEDVNVKQAIPEKLDDEITDCPMKHASNDQKFDDAVSEEKAVKENEHVCEVTIITETHVEHLDKDQKMDDDSGKDTDKVLDGQMTNRLNIENADNSQNKNDNSQQYKDDIETITTDHKTEGCNFNNKDIVSNNEQSYVDRKDNFKDDCEIIFMETDSTDEAKVSSSVNLHENDCKESTQQSFDISGNISCNSVSAAIIQNKIQTLICRELKPINSDMVHHSVIENLPDFYQKQIVTVKAPDEQLIPRNVFLNNTAYVLNLENLKLKSVTPAPSSSSGTYVSDEANEQHVRRIRSSYSNEGNHIHFNPQFYPNLRFAQQYRPFNYWNQYHWTYQRPFFPSMPFRFQFIPRMQPMFRCITARSLPQNLVNTDLRRARKRKRDNPKQYHLESIKKLALKLKSLVASGNRQELNIQALQRLIDTYNIRYKARIELTPQLDIVENEIILDTIELDDDDQSNSKKKKRQDMESYDENFNAMKQFSIKIKELELKKLLTTRHKRAFSNVIKTFNKSYNADVYVNSNYDIVDRRRIIIDSSSDSDCAVEEIQTTMEDISKSRKSRKLRNPFYILKQLSEKQSPVKTSQETVPEPSRGLKNEFQYSDHLKKMVSKYWLPSIDDFGRAEVPLKNQINVMDHCEEYLYEFMKSQPAEFKNWLEAKIAYWQSCQETACKYEGHSQNENVKLDSIIKPEDCTDLRNVLKKLSIIKTKKDIGEGSLSINFDVYNRDVPNFKKTKKPTPHFRVICISASSTLPSGAELASLHTKYNDDVTILFAIVGLSSISYLQMNPVDLPIYLPTNNIP